MWKMLDGAVSRRRLLHSRKCGWNNFGMSYRFFTLKPGPQRNTQWDLVRRVDILQLVPSVKLASRSLVDHICSYTEIDTLQIPHILI
jgi:hypothetical protein